MKELTQKCQTVRCSAKRTQTKPQIQKQLEQSMATATKTRTKSLHSHCTPPVVQMSCSGRLIYKRIKFI